MKPVVASTVLPLGATINMDGTALYVGIVSVRSAGLWHRLDVDGLSDHGGNDDPGFGRYGRCAECVSVPDGGGNGNHWHDCATDSRDGGFIIIDRPLDMLRTSINIAGDLAVSTAVATWEGEFDREVFDQPLNSDEIDQFGDGSSGTTSSMIWVSICPSGPVVTLSLNITVPARLPGLPKKPVRDI